MTARIQPKQIEEVDQFLNQGDTDVIVESDDFVCGGHPTTGAAAIANGVCFSKMCWRSSFVGAGSVTLVTTGQDSATRGVVQFASGTGAGDFGGIFRAAAGPVASIILATNQKHKFRFRFQIPVISDGTNTFTTRTGLFGTMAVALTDGIYIEASGPTNANWRGVALKASAPTVASGGTNVSLASGIGTFVEGTIIIDLTTTNTIYFFIGSVLIGTITNASTVIPTVALAEASINFRVAGATRNFLVDDWWQKLTYSPPRAPAAP